MKATIRKAVPRTLL
ncbi:hypothetical protein E2C01_096396 [Portunus trituberculatus]|uniref:Uncharacterized protein n=1 Tax=Portunus trituberculatus TaxID=210409 RepID=A0A5B7JVH8_PORTR|nr:hypothetical protein [Portunus trituberculatus]